MKFLLPPKFIASIMFVSFILAGCATQLAPTYDSQVVVGLNDLNKQSLVYFEEMSGDVSSIPYKDVEDSYNELIGATESLITQSDARPTPDNKAVKKINEMLAKKDQAIWDPNNKLPSTEALRTIAEDYRLLKDMHKDGSINDIKFSLRKNSIVLSLDQAITFEYALER